MTEPKSIDQDTIEKISFIGNVFGALFLYEPFSSETEEIYGLLGSLDVNSASTEWPFIEQDLSQGLLSRVRSSIEATIAEDLIWEYRRLFVGPARKAVPPWGSVYLDRDQVIFGISTLELRQWMRERGIGKMTDDEEPEDHIGRMLLLMSWISENRPEHLHSFLQDHLLPWAPHFLQLVNKETQSDYFAALAQLCEASLKGLSVNLGIDVPKARFYR